MKYYQVKKEFDGSEIMQADKHGRLGECIDILVANDLYTAKEFNKTIKGKGNNRLIADHKTIYRRPEVAFNIVEQSTKDNHWFFGCRFPNNQEKVKVIEPAIEEAKREFYAKAL